MPTRQGSADGENQHGDQRRPDQDRVDQDRPNQDRPNRDRTAQDRPNRDHTARERDAAHEPADSHDGAQPSPRTRPAPHDVDPDHDPGHGPDEEADEEHDDVDPDALDREPPRSTGPRRGGRWNGKSRTDSAKLAGRASAEAAVAAAEDEDTAPGARTPDLTAAAFFDVDNTMMMGASLFHFARGMAARKFFTASDLAGFAWQQLKFRIGGREDLQDVRSSSEQALSFVAGRKVSELVDLSEEIYDELMADRIWDGTRALAQHHLDRGQRVWLVTATPVELAQIIARRLGLTGALGTVAESSRGIYTGRLVGEMLHGRAKAHAVRALAASEGLDLRRCTAYSDSANDVPMLSAVGTAVAVNPDQRLRDVARARNWQIRDFRTGRKAARIGVHTALGAGAVAGAVAAGLRYHRR